MREVVAAQLQKEKRRTFMALKFFPILNFMLPSFSSSFEAEEKK